MGDLRRVEVMLFGHDAHDFTKSLSLVPVQRLYNVSLHLPLCFGVNTTLTLGFRGWVNERMERHRAVFQCKYWVVIQMVRFRN